MRREAIPAGFGGGVAHACQYNEAAPSMPSSGRGKGGTPRGGPRAEVRGRRQRSEVRCRLSSLISHPSSLAARGEGHPILTQAIACIFFRRVHAAGTCPGTANPSKI